MCEAPIRVGAYFLAPRVWRRHAYTGKRTEGDPGPSHLRTHIHTHTHTHTHDRNVIIKKDWVGFEWLRD